MDYAFLRTTGLRVSVLGLGMGGHRKLGLACGGTEANAIDIIRCAMDLSITHIWRGLKKLAALLQGAALANEVSRAGKEGGRAEPEFNRM